MTIIVIVWIFISTVVYFIYIFCILIRKNYITDLTEIVYDSKGNGLHCYLIKKNNPILLVF